jgi:hypothetical protein
MKNINLLLVFILSGLVFLNACDNKKSGRSAPGRAARGGNTVPFNNQSGIPNSQNPSGTSTSQWAYVLSNDANQFFQSVRGLVSASMDPQELGNVNNNGDVAIIGFVDMNQAGSINAANTRLRLEIWDDYAQSGQASEIAIAYNSLASSTVNGSHVELVFDDNNYGRILISGDYDQATFYGSVSFQNHKSFDGVTAPAAGVLGNFQVPVCGFFYCP